MAHPLACSHTQVEPGEKSYSDLAVVKQLRAMYMVSSQCMCHASLPG